MKRILLPSVLIAALAVPALAGTPAEDFGQKIYSDNSTPATLMFVANKLQGDKVDQKLPFAENPVVTRSVPTMDGVQKLADDLHVNAGDYDAKALVRMFIDAHD